MATGVSPTMIPPPVAAAPTASAADAQASPEKPFDSLLKAAPEISATAPATQPSATLAQQHEAHSVPGSIPIASSAFSDVLSQLVVSVGSEDAPTADATLPALPADATRDDDESTSPSDLIPQSLAAQAPIAPSPQQLPTSTTGLVSVDDGGAMPAIEGVPTTTPITGVVVAAAAAVPATAPSTANDQAPTLVTSVASAPAAAIPISENNSKPQASSPHTPHVLQQNDAPNLAAASALSTTVAAQSADDRASVAAPGDDGVAVEKMADGSVVAGGAGTLIARTADPAAKTVPPVLPQVMMPTRPESGFGDDFGARVSIMLDQGISHARIRINPEHLGAIDLQLRMEGDRVVAHFTSQHADVRAAIESSMPKLRDALSEQGMQLAQSFVGGQAAGQSGDGQRQTGTGGDFAALDTEDRATERAEVAAPIMSTKIGLVDVYA